MRHAAALLVILLAAACASRPPSTAHAHSKHVGLYVGYSGARWEQDFDVTSGYCDRATIGTLVHYGTGGLLAPGTTQRENRASATLIGAGVGDLVGRKVGEQIDEGDRACLGHALELGRAGKHVVWDNTLTGVHFELVPDDGHSDIAGLCRGFKLKARTDLGKSKRHGTACERSPGLWQMTRL